MPRRQGRFISSNALAAVGGVALVMHARRGNRRNSLVPAHLLRGQRILPGILLRLGVLRTAGDTRRPLYALAATMNHEYYTYFFVSAFSQAAVTFIGQNFAAGDLKRCDTIVRIYMTASYEATAGAMRGMGWSTLPAIVVIAGSCLLRIALIF